MMSNANATDRIVEDFFKNSDRLDTADIPIVALNAAVSVATKSAQAGCYQQAGLALRSLASATDDFIERLETGRNAVRS